MNADTAPLPEFVLPAKDGGWDILVRVQPGARKSECVGVMEGRLRVRLMAPAVENKANKALVAFIASVLGIKAAKVRLAAGDTSREKRLHVAGDCKPDWAKIVCCN